MNTALSSWTDSPRSPASTDPHLLRPQSHGQSTPARLALSEVMHTRAKPRLKHGSRGWGLLLAVALHGAALAALLSYAPARKAILAASPIVVTLISEPRLIEPPPPVPKPRPRQMPVERQVKPLVVPVESPKPEMPAPVVRDAAPPVQIAAAPEAVHLPPPVEAPPAAAAPPAPPPVVPPVYNAAYLDNPAPSYPPLARRAHEEGKVLLRVLVNARGAAESAEVKTSSGSARLDAAALDTVKRWRFVAARQGDQTISAWVVIPITFSLAS